MISSFIGPRSSEGKIKQSSRQINNKTRKFMGWIWNFHKTLMIGPVYMLKFHIPHQLMNIVLVSGYQILHKPFYVIDNLLPLTSCKLQPTAAHSIHGLIYTISIATSHPQQFWRPSFPNLRNLWIDSRQVNHISCSLCPTLSTRCPILSVRMHPLEQRHKSEPD